MCSSDLENFSRKGVSLIYKEEDDVTVFLKNEHVDFVIYRARDYRLLEELEAQGIKCFNNSLTNKIANDKFLTYQFLRNNKIACIPTYQSLEEIADCPIVMKSVDGHGGQEVYLLETKDEAKQRQAQNKRYIFQKYYQNNGDLRVYVLNNEVIGAVLRHSNSDFRHNFSLGGEVQSVEPDKEAINKALKIAELLNADYIGVDFLKVNDKWLVNEIEDPVGARMLYKASGLDITSLFVDCVYQSLVLQD